MRVSVPALLVCSVAVNVAVAAVLVRQATAGRGAAAGSAAYAVSAAPAEPFAVDTAEAESLGPKRALLLELERRHLADARRAAEQYWQNTEQYETGYGRAMLDGYDRIRAELVERFGPAAAADAAFSRLFRPLDPHFAFLSSAEQLAVQRLRFERDTQLRSAARDGAGPNAAAAANASALQAVNDAYRGRLGALLDSDSLREFLLRDSSLAQRIRDSRLTLSEREFRSMFELMWPLETGGAEIDTVVAARAELRNLLGLQRFARFWAGQDPLHARLQATAARLGIGASTADAVYAVMVEFQDRQLSAALSFEQDAAGAAIEAQRLAQQERAGIARLVGEDHAAAILDDRAAASLSRFNGRAATAIR